MMIDVATKDGRCGTEIVTPEGAGPWPAVVLCYDAGGHRKAMTEIAQQIAAGGYLVATPDLYHRSGSPGSLLPPGTAITITAMRAMFAEPAKHARWVSDFYLPVLDYDNLRSTVGAVLDVLADREDVTGKVGTTGYCMGGNASFRIATVLGDRLAATAAFHPGGLVTDQPDSPHLRCATIRARVLVAGASEDRGYTAEHQAALIEALAAAEVEATVATYPAKHGFAVRDNDSYDPACAERHHAALSALFAATLR